MQPVIFIIVFFMALISGLPLAVALDSDTQHIFYYHGKIVEDQGAEAHNAKFGSYEYYKILAALKNENSVLHAELRQKNTDISDYAKQQAAYIAGLIKSGIPAAHITLIGASKGARIVVAIQEVLQEADLRSVLLAGMFPSVVTDSRVQLYGSILSIYDQSDALVTDPAALLQRSKKLTEFKEVIINKNLAHGLLFKPYPEWVVPALKWAQKKPLNK